MLQVCGDMVGISAVVAAMLGLSVLLLTGVLTWRDCLTYPPAWDTLFWFAVLVGAPSATLPVQIRRLYFIKTFQHCESRCQISCGPRLLHHRVSAAWCAGIAGQLNALGVIGHFADVVGSKLTTMNMGWPAVMGLLSLAYYGLHYMFASQTAHVGALYSAFLAMMLTAGEIRQRRHASMWPCSIGVNPYGMRRMPGTLHTCSNHREAELMQAAEDCCQPRQVQSVCRRKCRS
jgi:divalent anion:Na+ symporter, DASS family